MNGKEAKTSETANDEVIIDDRYLQQHYGISKTTAWRFRRREQNPIPFFYVGAQIRYRLSEVRAFFESEAEKAAA